MSGIVFRDLGRMDYQECWDYQESLFRKWMSFKREGAGTDSPENTVLFVEHPHVYTLGKSGNESNLLVQGDFLNRIGASFYRINRGGDITYHGPGQIVGYPIIDLADFGMGLKDYIRFLEDSIIDVCRQYGIEGEKSAEATGVWIDPEDVRMARKICAIGVRSSRFVTMHGFAFNVNTDLSYFSYINPCGFQEKEVTSMEKELGTKQDLEAVKSLLKRTLIEGLESRRG